MRKSANIWIICLLGGFYYAQAQDLGKIDFPTSGSEAAQAHFIEGSLLLHSFEFEDAREAYQKAQKVAPGFAMAYWGEAMTHFHPLWDHHDQEKGKAALNKLGENTEARLAKAPTEKEKDWVKAVEILYAEGESNTQIQAYSDFMGILNSKYPDDHEFASFYAISLLSTSFQGRDSYKYMHAASIVEEVYANNPLHPGALHYLIHSYDDPIHAPLGMRAAIRYAEVAPDAAHALHMPSHIFIAMGMWDRVVGMNEQSSSAADRRRARKNLGVDSRGFHSLHWLQYGYLQQGRQEKALELLNNMQKDYQESRSRRAAYHLAVMRAGYLIETQDWEHAANTIQIDKSKLPKKALAVDRFVRGLAYMKQGKLLSTQKLQEQLEAMAPMAQHQDMFDVGGGKTTCCSPNYSTKDDDDPGTIHAIHVMNMQLQAIMRYESGRKEEAVELMKKASDMEGNMDFMFGPPIIAKPSFELLGEMLLETGKFTAAAAAFETALKRAPGRTQSLKGLEKAYTQAGEAEKASVVQQLLEKNLAQADAATQESLKGR